MGPLEKVMHEHAMSMLRKPIEDLLSRKLPAHGIKLPKRRINELAGRIAEGKDLETELGPEYADKLAAMVLTDEEAKLLDSEADRIANELSDVNRRFAAEFSVQILAVLKRKWRKEWAAQRRDHDGFRKRLETHWGEGLQGLRMLVTVSREYGSDINNAGRTTGQQPSKTFEMLTRLHARACQVAEEVVCLLGNGLADGAMARWRTLHEIAAVAHLIQLHGDDLAVRYERHQIVESWKGAQQYQKHQKRLRQEPIDNETLESIKTEYDRAIKNYGQEFKTQYGWAAAHLKKSAPTVKDIQEAAGIDYLAPYYKMASHNVHANPKGVMFKLGLVGEADILLAGSSNAGLADPGHATALSLVHMSALLLDFFPTLDNMVRVKIMHQLEAETGEALLAAHKKQKDEERIRRAVKD